MNYTEPLRMSMSPPVMRQMQILKVVKSLEGPWLEFPQSATVELEVFQFRQVDEGVVVDHFQF